MNRFSRRRLLWSSLALGAAALAVAALFLQGPDELEKFKADLRARGEKLTLQEWSVQPAEETLLWLDRFGEAANLIQTSPVNPGLIECMRTNGLGQASVAWKQPRVPVLSTSSHSWEDLARQMHQSARGLAALRLMLDRPPTGSSLDLTRVFQPGFSRFLIEKRIVAQSLLAAVVSDLHERALASAHSNLTALITLSRVNAQEYSLVDQMIRVAVADLGLHATWEAWAAEDWTDQQLAGWQSAWREIDIIGPLERTIQTERAVGIAYFALARTNRAGPSLAVGPASGFAEKLLDEAVLTPLWKGTWSRQDELLYLKSTESILQAVRAGRQSRSWTVLQAALQSGAGQESAGFMHRMFYRLSNALRPNWTKAFFRVMQTETFRHQALAALAIGRFQLRYGRLPETLEALVPEYLSELPWDYLHGQALRYVPSGASGYRLYSVGKNGKDDGGGGDDLAWPSPL